jgi:8-oxo-dGTP diphosphatase
LIYARRVKNILKSPSLPLSAPILIVAAAALIDSAGHVLVQQRPPGGSMTGLWEFPGGKIERGETPEAALARELREELGIEVGALAPLTFASAPLADRHLLLLLYHCSDWQGVPKALHASALRWVMPVELYDLPMPPADRPLIASLIALP